MRFLASLHHLFQVNGLAFAYLSTSGAVIGLDALAETILKACGEPPGLDPREWIESQASAPEQQAQLLEAFQELSEMGCIHPAGEQPLPVPPLPPMPFPLSTLVLNVTNKCNLSCTYCYEYGEDRIKQPARKQAPPRAPMMSPETARQSVDFLIQESRGQRRLTITFFGGETLLNFSTIKAAVIYAKERARETGQELFFSLTTNATLLTDAVIEFLVQERFGINISIDGAREDHDRHRTFKSGRGSYEIIRPRIQKLLQTNRSRGRPIGARVTLTAGFSHVVELYRHLTEEVGFDQVGFAPVTSAPGRDYALSAEHYEHLLEAYRELAMEFVARALEGKPHGFSNINDLLREIHQGVNKAHPCGAGLGLLGVSTEGHLGLCHRFVESGDHEVGSLEEGLDASRREAFLKSAHVSHKEVCQTCFARPLCAGGCYHEAHVRFQDATSPNLHVCHWIRSWTALGLASYGRIMQGNPGFFERFERHHNSATKKAAS